MSSRCQGGRPATPSRTRVAACSGGGGREVLVDDGPGDAPPVADLQSATACPGSHVSRVDDPGRRPVDDSKRSAVVGGLRSRGGCGRAGVGCSRSVAVGADDRTQDRGGCGDKHAGEDLLHAGGKLAEVLDGAQGIEIHDLSFAGNWPAPPPARCLARLLPRKGRLCVAPAVLATGGAARPTPRARRARALGAAASRPNSPLMVGRRWAEDRGLGKETDVDVSRRPTSTSRAPPSGERGLVLRSL